MYDFLLTVHVLAAVMWVGGGVTLHVLGRRALASGDPDRMLSFSREAGWVGPKFYAPLSVVLLVAGVLLVSEAGFSHSDAWISIAYVGWLTSFVIGIGVYPRIEARLEKAAEAGGASDPGVEAGMRSILNVNSFEILVLLLVVVDMTTKPFQ